MSNNFSGEYRGTEVWFSVSGNVWRWKNGEAKTYSAITAQIDKALKENLNALKAICLGWSDTYEVVEVTSIDEDGNNAWVKRNGKREKVSLKSLISYTEKNLAILEERGKLNLQRNALLQEVAELMGRADLLDIKELTEV